MRKLLNILRGSGLVWSGLVWSGLVWSGLVWSGLVWSGLVWSANPAEAKVRFITNAGDNDNFYNDSFKCPNKYQKCLDTQYGLGSPCGGDLYLSCKCKPEYNQICTSPKIGDGVACDGKYKSCKCPDEYNTTCSSPKVTTTGATSCDGKYKSENCYCPSNYQYTSSNCSGDYAPAGSSCDGKYSTCSCIYSNVSCGSNQSCSSSKCGGSVCIACKDNCTPSCSGIVSSCPSGQLLTTVSNGCGWYCSSCVTNASCSDTEVTCGSTTGGCNYNSCGKCISCKPWGKLRRTDLRNWKCWAANWETPMGASGVNWCGVGNDGYHKIVRGYRLECIKNGTNEVFLMCANRPGYGRVDNKCNDLGTCCWKTLSECEAVRSGLETGELQSSVSSTDCDAVANCVIW